MALEQQTGKKPFLLTENKPVMEARLLYHQGGFIVKKGPAFESRTTLRLCNPGNPLSLSGSHFHLCGERFGLD